MLDGSEIGEENERGRKELGKKKKVGMSWPGLEGLGEKCCWPF